MLHLAKPFSELIARYGHDIAQCRKLSQLDAVRDELEQIAEGRSAEPGHRTFRECIEQQLRVQHLAIVKLYTGC